MRPKILLAAMAACATLFAQEPVRIVNDGSLKVKIKSIEVRGSRVSAKSMAALTGLNSGQMVDETNIRTALDRANKSGLFKAIEFTYESEPGSTDVVLVLEAHDELPLLPAKIAVPGEKEDEIWAWLQKVDPVFVKELPANDAAIKLYARYISKYLQTRERTEVVLGEVKGDGAGKPASILFAPGKMRGAPPANKSKSR